MTTASNIEASLEVCEILNLEVQTLSKDAETLDGEIAGLRGRKEELEQTIEEQKGQLLFGTRHLKSLNIQRLQAEYSTQDCKDQIGQLVKSFDSKASIYGRLEEEAMILEREVSWKREDIDKLCAVRDAHRLTQRRHLEPKIEERNALKEELERVGERLKTLREEEKNSAEEKDEEKRDSAIEKLKNEITVLENRNEAYQRRMRNALDDLSAKVVITRQRISRMGHGQSEPLHSERDVRWTPSQHSMRE